MPWALTNLDNGLFLERGDYWTADLNLAARFDDLENASQVAAQKNVRNAAMAMVSGKPARVSGFIWTADSN